ncbi:MAG TPA: YSC84-related protein [Burkholderiaceae bacterium]
MNKTFPLRRTIAAFMIAGSSLIYSSCSTTTTPPNSQSHHADRREINEGVDAGLAHLYDTTPGARAIGNEAKGILVFPSVFQAGLIVGGEYGRGALRVNGVTERYYSIAAGSVGWQIGAQSKGIIIMFMTNDALNHFRQSNGWQVGADATVAVATIGANGQLDTNLAHQQVVGFVTTNAGVMAGVSLEGAKISPIQP